MSNEALLKEICFKKAKDLNLGTEYEDRFDYEFNIISGKGFIDYFLIQADIIKWARENGIEVGLGRGSAGGSLVSYLMNITQIDPLKYGLLFERFLDPKREAFPDIDVDFQKSRREEVIKYTEEKYGKENVCRIVNLVRFKPRSVTKDICRIFDVPFQKANKLTKLIPKDMKTLDEAMQIKEVKDFYDANPKYKRIAYKLEGSIKNFSIHAAGVVITPDRTSSFVPILTLKSKNGERVVCSAFDKNMVEDLGLLKLDFLGLRTLDVVAETLRQIRKKIKLPLEFGDLEVYKNIIQTGKTLGVFQFETDLLTNMARRMKINSFDSLCAATAAVRPGAANSGSAERYIQKLLGERETTYLDEMFRPQLEETLGELLYQETVMNLAHQVGRIELSRTYRMIKEISKSKGLEALQKYEEEFVNGCIVSGVKGDSSQRMWDIIKESGNYLFNKSHAIEYSGLSYQTAWLKNYYLKEFLVALIHFPKTKKEEKEKMISQAIRELRDNGHEVLPPDVNMSGTSIMIADDGKIYMGLVDVSGCGEKACENIIENRPYADFDDFMSKIQRQKVNIKIIKNLIQAGCFDKFARRDQLYYSVATDETFKEWDDKELVNRQMKVLDLPSEKPLIDYYDNPYKDNIEITPIANVDFSAQNEEVWIRGIVSDYVLRKTADGLNGHLGRTKEMAFFEIDDGTMKSPAFIAPETLLHYKSLLEDGAPVILKVHTWGKASKFYVDAVLSLEKENDSTLEKYVEDRRSSTIAKYYIEDPKVRAGVIKLVSYHASKKSGKPYARITFKSNDFGLCFNLPDEPFKVGEVLHWTSRQMPFIQIIKRIP